MRAFFPGTSGIKKNSPEQKNQKISTGMLEHFRQINFGCEISKKKLRKIPTEFSRRKFRP